MTKRSIGPLLTASGPSTARALLRFGRTRDVGIRHRLPVARSSAQFPARPVVLQWHSRQFGRKNSGCGAKLDNLADLLLPGRERGLGLPLDHGAHVFEKPDRALAIALDRLDGEFGRSAIDELERDVEQRHALGERRRPGAREPGGCDVVSVGHRLDVWHFKTSVPGLRKTRGGYHASGVCKA